MKPITDPSFKYTSAEASKKPGYLKRKFDKIRQQQRDVKDEQTVKVTTLHKASGGKA